MAVLVEGVSVIVRRLDIDAKYPRGWAGYVDDCPNTTLCADAHLARVGFMAPADAQLFIGRLGDQGFVVGPNPVGCEVAVVDHVGGTLQSADWLQVGGVRVDGHDVCACRLAGDESTLMITPDGWSWDKSLYRGAVQLREPETAGRWRFLRFENGLDVFLDLETGKEKFVGRTGLSKLVDDPASAKRRDVN